jgi:CheY-like chemotaxis protein
MHYNATPIEILLVEDNPGDVRLTQEALKDARVLNRLSVAADGVAALAYLRRQGEFAGAPRPDMILLDLNLPKKHGREVLEEIKADADLKRIPVVILTTSQLEEDMDWAHDLRAYAYITKPIDLYKLVGVARSIQEFYITIMKAPPTDIGAAGLP